MESFVSAYPLGGPGPARLRQGAAGCIGHAAAERQWPNTIEFYDLLFEPADLEAEIATLREEAGEHRELLVADAQLLSEVKAVVRLPFRLEYEVEQRVAPR